MKRHKEIGALLRTLQFKFLDAPISLRFLRCPHINRSPRCDADYVFIELGRLATHAVPLTFSHASQTNSF